MTCEVFLSTLFGTLEVGEDMELYLDVFLCNPLSASSSTSNRTNAFLCHAVLIEVFMSRR